MKNLILQREIIKQSFRTFGIGFGEKTPGILQSLIDPEFLIKQKISFTDDDENSYSNQIWSAISNIENLEIKIIIFDLKQNNIKEYLLIIQMDNFPPFLFRVSEDLEDYGNIHCFVEKKWIVASSYLQARALVGVEGLSEIFLNWKKLEKYQELYQIGIDFLNTNED